VGEPQRLLFALVEAQQQVLRLRALRAAPGILKDVTLFV